MTLAELLEPKFRADIRFRGEAYLKAERVAIMRVTADRVTGVVRDGGEYETQLSRSNGDLQMHCNCDQKQKIGVCKHLWATILAVQERDYVTGTPRPGHIPPFATEPQAVRPTTSGAAGNRALARPDQSLQEPPESPFLGRPRRRGWETALEDLRRQMEDRPSPGTAATREREIFYEIDVAASRDAGQLVIQTSQRQRRANGQWGKLKPLKLRPGRFDDVDHEDDRTILAYLAGGTPDRSNWQAQQAVSQALLYRYRVAQQLCLLILPLMCRTGRLRYLGDKERAATPLNWDDGPAWQLTAAVDYDEQRGRWRLSGRLRRNGRTLSLDETKLLLPGGLVFTRTNVARLDDFGAFAWVSLLQGDDAVSVPDGQQGALVESLLDMPAVPRLELPEELRLEEVSCRPVPRLTLRSPRGRRWHLQRLQGRVAFDYLGTSVPAASVQWAVVQRDQGRCIIRDREFEEQAWAQLQEQGFRRLLERRGEDNDVEIAARDLGPAVRNLMAAGWQAEADGKHVHQPSDLRFKIRSGIDWFELHADVDFEGRSIPFPELLSALARGDTTVRLDDGSLGILPEDWARRFGLLGGLGVAEEEHVQFEHNQVALLDALLSAQQVVEVDDRFLELRDKLRAFEGVQPAGEPAGFRGELREYQRVGLGWLQFLQQFRLGGCLADDMGLGKTVQLLALLEDRRERRKEPLPSLIVVPKSLLFNWRQECARFTPKLKVVQYTGLDRHKLRKRLSKYDLVLTTYGTMRRDILQLKETQFDYVVLDEAQMIKNAASQAAKASRLIRANHRVALSGTPIENHLGDLWSIFEFLNSGMLGRSSIFKSFAADADDEDSRKLLSQALRPFILRRTKAHVASELPERTEQTIHCSMRKEQRRKYEELRDHYRSSLLGMVSEQGIAKSRMHVLEALLRLRQAACHPGLLDDSRKDESSAKLDVLCPHLEELLEEGHKALVFSQFTSMLAIVRRHLEARNMTYEYLDGQTRRRKERVERFQNDAQCGVFLISLKAGGLGLNLTSADYVFLLDPWWNPAVEAQAIDRAHRVGQTRHVVAYRLICRGTVEEKIAELQGRKRALADAILTADKSLLRDLTTDDLKMLLS